MELMIATAVFSIVLLVAQVSFLQIGKLNTKGLTSTRTQNIATQILAQIKSSIQTAPPGSISPSGQTGNGYTYFCAGGNRYTYNLGTELDLTTKSETFTAGGNYGILEDSLNGAAACAPPCYPAGSCTTGEAAFNNPTELLGNKMRVDQLDVSQADSSTNLFQISLVIVYGDDSGLSQPKDPDNVACSGNLSSQNFCYVSRLSAYAFEGVSG